MPDPFEAVLGFRRGGGKVHPPTEPVDAVEAFYRWACTTWVEENAMLEAEAHESAASLGLHIRMRVVGRDELDEAYFAIEVWAPVGGMRAVIVVMAPGLDAPEPLLFRRAS